MYPSHMFLCIQASFCPLGKFLSFDGKLCSGAQVIPLTSTPDQQTRLFLSPVDEAKQAPGEGGKAWKKPCQHVRVHPSSPAVLNVWVS